MLQQKTENTPRDVYDAGFNDDDALSAPSRRQPHRQTSAMSRRGGRNTGRQPRGVAIIVPWTGRPDALADRLEAASDWGPFELMSLTQVSTRPASDEPEYELRFAIHSGGWQVEHLIDNFLDRVRTVTPYRIAMSLDAL